MSSVVMCKILNQVSGVFSKNAVRLVGTLLCCSALLTLSTLAQTGEVKHSDIVTSVKLLPGGELALSGSKDGTIKVWEIATGKCLRTFFAHEGGVNTVAISPDGKIVASGGNGGVIKLWDVAGWREIKRLINLNKNSEDKEVLSLSFSPDGKTILSGNADSSVRLWNQETGREIVTFHGHQGPVKSVSFSPDGKIALSAGPDLLGGIINVLDVGTGKALLKIKDDSLIKFASYLSDGRTILSGGDRALKLWDANTGKQLRVIDTKYYIDSAALSKDGKLALTGDSNGYIQVWDVRTGMRLHKLVGNSNTVFSLAITSDGIKAISGNADGSLTMWDLVIGTKIRSFPASKNDDFPIGYFNCPLLKAG